MKRLSYFIFLLLTLVALVAEDKEKSDAKEDKKTKVIKKTLVFGSTESKSLKKIIQNIYKEINERSDTFEIKLQHYSLARSHREIIAENIDGEIGRMQGITKDNPELKDIIQLKENLLEINACVYVKSADEHNYADFKNLKNVKIAYDTGYLMITKVFPKKIIIGVDSDSHAFEMLKLDRVDAAVFLELDGVDTIVLTEAEKKKYRKAILFKISIAPLINKKYAEFVPEFEKIIKELKKEKVLEKLIKNDLESKEANNDSPIKQKK